MCDVLNVLPLKRDQAARTNAIAHLRIDHDEKKLCPDTIEKKKSPVVARRNDDNGPWWMDDNDSGGAERRE